MKAVTNGITQPKVFQVACLICDTEQEYYGLYSDQGYMLQCPYCNENTNHYIVLGGTGYRWKYCDINHGEATVGIGQS